MLANLRALFASLVDIMLLRRGPDSLPASAPLLALFVLLYLVLDAVAYHTLFVPLVPDVPSSWPLQLVVLQAATLAWWRVAFQLARKPERFVQTMIAVVATNALLIPAMPLLAALVPYLRPKPDTAADQAPATLLLLTALIYLWAFVVLVRIVRSAFEWSWPASVLFAIGSGVGPMIVLSILFGAPQKAA